jgi:radical SAM protein with 4Fe4S-binding SPASM domain
VRIAERLSLEGKNMSVRNSLVTDLKRVISKFSFNRRNEEHVEHHMVDHGAVEPATTPTPAPAPAPAQVIESGLYDVAKESPAYSALLTSGILKHMSHDEHRLRPVLLICETVNVCNQDCIFCPYSDQTRPKGVMSLDTFHKAVTEYADFGGGVLSMTPIVGDVLLDRFLMERLTFLDSLKDVIRPTVTTNLVGLHRLNDEQVKKLLGTFERIHISCYGTTAEENLATTRKPVFDDFVKNADRFARLWKESGKKCEVKLAFRNIYNHTPEELEAFIKQVFGIELPYSAISTYANWGNSIKRTLPGDAQWAPDTENTTPCVLLATAVQVYWDGRVTACACCDYDASAQLSLGNVNESKLLDIYNGSASREIWQQHGSGALPELCKNCTFHLPVAHLTPEHSLVANPVEFIGG